jgi:hypothetical protein
MPLILNFSVSCGNYAQSTMTSTTAKQTLEQKHGISIQIEEVMSPDISGKTTIKAHPVDKPELRFQADFSDAGNLLESNYPQMYWSRQAEVIVNDKLSISSLQQIPRITFYDLSQQNFDPKSLLDFQDLIKQEGLNSRVDVRSHFFADGTDADDIQLVVNSAHNALSYLYDLGINTIYFNISVYDKSVAKKIKLSEYHYGYNQIKEGSFEQVHKDALQKRLVFEVKSDEKLPSAEDLNKIIDHNPSYFGSRVNRFN